jgi:alkyl hydroperoxide reductase subunit AhpC
MALYNEILVSSTVSTPSCRHSVDGVWCHLAFAGSKPHSLLADFEPACVARAYGVYREHDGTSERALFVIDADGIIRWSYVRRGRQPGR